MVLIVDSKIKLWEFSNFALDMSMLGTCACIKIQKINFENLCQFLKVR